MEQSQLQSDTPFEMLKKKVYPVLNKVILKLIDHIVKTEEVQKHEQRLKKKKIIDQLERKYLSRDIEKQQMGSDYQQSDDEQLHRMLGMKAEQVEALVRGRIAQHRQNILDDEPELQPNVFDPLNFIIQELKDQKQQSK